MLIAVVSQIYLR